MKLILLGPPGSGKGTISSFLIRDYFFKHISPGEVLRDEVVKKTELGQEIKKYIDKGNLVPDAFVNQIVALEIRRKRNFLLDGYPRNLGQARFLVKITKIDLVLLIKISDEKILERLSLRRICPKCERVYHLKYIKPKKDQLCDFCKIKLIQRNDDKKEVIKERLRVYHQETKPLIDFYKKKRILKEINGLGKPEEVYQRAKKVIFGK